MIRNRVPTHIRPTDEDTRKRRMDQGRTAPSRLRLTEALHLRVGDIDPRRRLVHVQRGKGRRDRYVPLNAIEVLQA